MLGGLHHELVHFLLGDLDAVLVADLGKEEAKADAALGDGAIFVLFLLHLGQGGLRVFLVARLMLELLPDLLELGIDHRFRHREIVAGGELVEQLALHMGAGEAVQLLLDLAPHQLAELIDPLHAHRLGEIVVRLDRACDLHLVDSDVERGRAALQVIDGIGIREGDADDELIIGLCADQLVLEARDQAAGADFQRHAGAGAAVERLAIDLALIIEHDEIALLRLVLGGGGIVALLALCEPVHRGVDRLGFRLDAQALDLQAVDLGLGNVRQGLDLDGQHRILAATASLKRDLGLHGRADLLLVEKPLDAVLDGALQRLLLQLRAVHLAHQIGGHLAGAEAGHAHLRRDRLQLLVDERVDLLGGNGDPVGALQALVQRLDSLHLGFKPSLSAIPALRAGLLRNWCGRRDSNPHIFRYQDLNLARLPVPPRPLRPARRRPIAGRRARARREGGESVPTHADPPFMANAL